MGFSVSAPCMCSVPWRGCSVLIYLSFPRFWLPSQSSTLKDGMVGMVNKSNSVSGGGRWCVICGSALADGVCPKCGSVRAFLPFDPLAAEAVAVHCDRIGIVNVEAAC